MTSPSTPQGFARIPKVAWLAGGGLAIAVAILLILVPSRAQAPRVAEMLPAKETVGFVALESPDQFLKEFDRAAVGLSDDEKRALSAFLSTDSRVAALGFDPAQAAGWQKAGVDPERGLAIALDARSPSGTALPAFAWVADGPPRSPKADALKWQPQEKWSVASLSAAAWQAPTGPRLAGDPVLRAAFADMPTGPRAAIYAHADGVLAALKPQFTDKKLAALEHVTQRVRGFSLVMAPDRAAGRIVLSTEGTESLRQIFGTEAPKDPFSHFLPKDGVVALRVSLNLQEIFDGLMTWLPPQWMEARLGLASGRLGLLAMTGVDWSQLERALAGQAVLAVDLSAAATPDVPVHWLALLTVRDAALADAAVQHFAQTASQRGRSVVAKPIEGHTGWVSQDPPVVVVRVDHTLIVAPTELDVVHALHRPDPLPDTPDLDGDVVLGFLLHSTPQPVKTDAANWQAAFARLEPMSMALRRDPHGLRLEASAFPLSSVVHVAGWFLRPKPGE